jgi:hypothetical protein
VTKSKIKSSNIFHSLNFVGGNVIPVTLINARHSLIFVAVDFLAAMLIRATGHKLQMARSRSLKLLDLTKAVNDTGGS